MTLSLTPRGRTSPLQQRGAPLVDRGGASPGDGDGCAWCGGPKRRGQTFCCKNCRQSAFRIRKRHKINAKNQQPMVMAIADPPYPGMAWMYKGHRDYAGEVDHVQLVASLERHYDGFALCTSAKALGEVLPLFTRPYRVCPWVKPHGVSGKTWGLHNAWEPVIVVPGRELRPGKRDWLRAHPARGGGSDLIGRKPGAWCVWVFELLGLLPGDRLDDLFPGSGIVGRAWAELCRKGPKGKGS